VLGCGNILFGDDGFGPAVIDYLEKHCRAPKDVSILDVGTGAREILFTIALSQRRPKRIVIIDALDCRRKPGEFFTVPEDLCHVEVILLAAQPESVPETVKPGLSRKLQDAVPKVCEYIVKNYF